MESNKQNKGGRPKKDSLEKRDIKLTVHLNQAEFRIIKLKSDMCKPYMSLSEFMRNAAFKKEIKTNGHLPQVLSELHKIGSNLNQIAKVANTTWFLSIDEKEQLNTIINLLQITLTKIFNQ